MGIAGGTAVVGQKLLEAIFGEEAVRRLAKEAKAALEKRYASLLDGQQQRFLERLAPAQADVKRLDQLATRLGKLGTQGGKA